MRATLLPLLLFGAARAEEEAAPKPVLLHRTERAFVHALRSSPRAAPHHVERVLADGWRLLLTDRATGDMRDLVEPTGTVAISTRRVSYQQSRLLGVVGDDERVYVLLWQSGRVREPPGEEMEGGRYELRAFRLEDGASVPAPALDPARLCPRAPPECAGPGPLRLVDGRVTCAFSSSAPPR